MDVAAAEELELCWLQASAEARTHAPGGPAPANEALQKALWRHREAIIHLVRERPAVDQLVDHLKAARRPFGRAAVLAPAGNPVLVSIPMDDGRAWVQFRASDFHLAAELAEGR